MLYSNDSKFNFEELKSIESKILNNSQVNPILEDPFASILLSKNIDLLSYRNELLIKSIIKTLQLVNNRDNYYIVSLSNESTDELPIFNTTEISNVDELNPFLNSISSTYSSKFGIISYLMSIILTRSIRYVTDDMDDPSQPLIGNYGHCSQELVNLFLTGQATSNVFSFLCNFLFIMIIGF